MSKMELAASDAAKNDQIFLKLLRFVLTNNNIPSTLIENDGFNAIEVLTYFLEDYPNESLTDGLSASSIALLHMIGEQMETPTLYDDIIATDPNDMTDKMINVLLATRQSLFDRIVFLSEIRSDSITRPTPKTLRVFFERLSNDSVMYRTFIDFADYVVKMLELYMKTRNSSYPSTGVLLMDDLIQKRASVAGESEVINALWSPLFLLRMRNLAPSLEDRDVDAVNHTIEFLRKFVESHSLAKRTTKTLLDIINRRKRGRRPLKGEKKPVVVDFTPREYRDESERVVRIEKESADESRFRTRLEVAKRTVSRLNAFIKRIFADLPTREWKTQLDQIMTDVYPNALEAMDRSIGASIIDIASPPSKNITLKTRVLRTLIYAEYVLHFTTDDWASIVARGQFSREFNRLFMGTTNMPDYMIEFIKKWALLRAQDMSQYEFRNPLAKARLNRYLTRITRMTMLIDAFSGARGGLDEKLSAELEAILTGEEIWKKEIIRNVRSCITCNDAVAATIACRYNNNDAFCSLKCATNHTCSK